MLNVRRSTESTMKYKKYNRAPFSSSLYNPHVFIFLLFSVLYDDAKEKMLLFACVTFNTGFSAFIYSTNGL